MPKTITVDTREGHLGLDISDSTVCQGCKVDNVHPKDLCALAGLKAGMVITHINDEAFSSHDLMMSTMNEAKALQKKITLVALTEEEAVEEGAVEWAMTKKWMVRIAMIVAVIIVAVVMMFKFGVIEFQQPEPKERSPDPMNAFLAGDAAGMVKNVREGLAAALDKMPPEAKAKLDEMKANGVGLFDEAGPKFPVPGAGLPAAAAAGASN